MDDQILDARRASCPRAGGRSSRRRCRRPVAVVRIAVLDGLFTRIGRVQLVAPAPEPLVLQDAARSSSCAAPWSGCAPTSPASSRRPGRPGRSRDRAAAMIGFCARYEPSICTCHMSRNSTNRRAVADPRPGARAFADGVRLDPRRLRRRADAAESARRFDPLRHVVFEHLEVLGREVGHGHAVRRDVRRRAAPGWRRRETAAARGAGLRAAPVLPRQARAGSVSAASTSDGADARQSCGDRRASAQATAASG